MKKFKIADFVVEVRMDDNYIPSEFSFFQCREEEPTDIVWEILIEQPPELNRGQTMQEMGCFQLCKCDNKVVAYYPDPGYFDVPMIVYENNYTKVTYYLQKGYGDNNDREEVERERLYFLAFFQEAFFLAMLFQGGISIHSASLIYREKGFVFTALSGTGKTTHTNMWTQLYETPILDGDVTLCRMVGGKPWVYGLPWSGSSNTFLNQAVELGGIVFLQQAEVNDGYIPDFAESFERLLARSFTPLWFEEFLDNRFEIVMNILASGVTCHVLGCRADYEAVEVIKNQIDQNWVN